MIQSFRQYIYNLKFEIWNVDAVSIHILACSDGTNWIFTFNGAELHANNGKYLTSHKDPARVIKFKQNICDNVLALAVEALFIMYP